MTLPHNCQVHRRKSPKLLGNILRQAQRMLEQPDRYLLAYAHSQPAPTDSISEQTHMRTAQPQPFSPPQQPLHEAHSTHHTRLSLFPVLVLLRALRVHKLSVGFALDTALSAALEHTFLAPQVRSFVCDCPAMHFPTCQLK